MSADPWKGLGEQVLRFLDDDRRQSARSPPFLFYYFKLWVSERGLKFGDSLASSCPIQVFSEHYDIFQATRLRLLKK
jgi:hypothetical protein